MMKDSCNIPTRYSRMEDNSRLCSDSETRINHQLEEARFAFKVALESAISHVVEVLIVALLFGIAIFLSRLCSSSEAWRFLMRMLLGLICTQVLVLPHFWRAVIAAAQVTRFTAQLAVQARSARGRAVRERLAED